MASPHSPGDGPTTSGGDFDTDLLPLSSNGGDRRQSAASEYDSQNEAEEDRNLFIDEEIVAEAEEDEGEDLYPDNFMEQCVSETLPNLLYIDGYGCLGFVMWVWYAMVHPWSSLCRDYQTLEEQDRYEVDGLDDEVEDTRDFATIMRDRRAAEENMEERDGMLNHHSRVRKLPTMLQEYGTLKCRGCYLHHF